MRPPGREALSVSEVTARIDKELSRSFRDVWVTGEVTEFSAYSSGHWYFSLKDDKSRLKCVMFKFKNSLLRFRPENGGQVLCRGRIAVYAPRGEYQLAVEYMEPTGRGALALEFERLKERLLREGLFDAGRKRRLPEVVRRVALITSVEGAALHDMLRVLGDRAPGVEVVVVPSRVQGRGAEDELARALALVNAVEAARPAGLLPLDAVILARGGGSLEDLWAFNEEVLARAVVASAVPVISAVGHETDFTIADLAADVRAATPTAAAELIASGSVEQCRELARLEALMVREMGRLLERSEVRLENAGERLRAPVGRVESLMMRVDELALRNRRAVVLRLRREDDRVLAAGRTLAARDPRDLYKLQAARLEHVRSRMMAAGRSALERRENGLSGLAGRLAALSPRATLERGYAIARDAEGRVLRDAGSASVGDEVEVLLWRGRLDVEVRRVKRDDEGDGS